MTSLRFGMRKALVLPVVFATFFALYHAFGSPPLGYIFAAVGGSAVSGIILVSRSTRDWMPAIVGLGCGIAAGIAVPYDSCTPMNEPLGVLTGFTTLRIARRIIGKRGSAERMHEV